MARIAKIYCTRDELATYAPKARLIEPYDAFQVVELSPAALKAASNVVPVEDITPQFKLKLGARAVNTAKPRYDATGKMHKHTAYAGEKKLSAGPHHYVVQFVGPIKQAWLKAVKKAGGVYRGPLRDFAVIVRMDEEALVRVAALPFVRWTGHLPHKARIAPEVFGRGAVTAASSESAGDQTSRLSRGGGDLRGVLVLQFFDKKDLAAAKKQFDKCGAPVVNIDSSAGVALVRVPDSGPARKQVVANLAAIHGVRFITRKSVPRTFNDVAPAFMGTARVTATSGGGLGLSGENEIVAIADTGLDTGDPATVLVDFRGRVKAIHSWPIDRAFDAFVTNRRADDGPADVASGHGTHVAGSVLGAGSPGAGGAARIRGLANKAQLVFQAIEQKLNFASADAAAEFDNDPYQLAGIPTSLTKLFQQAYDAGARVHSNSWGGGKFGEYDAQSRQLDEFVWRNKDFCVLVAAGNDGRDLLPQPDGFIDEGSVTPPGTAKNCITVGASESERPQFAEVTYFQFRRKLFSKNPTKSDKVADNHDQMAAFSSRGPTGDGRVKPDVTAPGTYILSTRSTQLPSTEEGWAPYPPNSNYFYMGGTSMATPLTAGAIVVLREWFRKKGGIANPSAALLKAALICGAHRMPLPYVQGNPLFDMHQGYGRVDLDRVLAPQGGATFGYVDRSPGLQTGQQFQQNVTVVGGRPLRVVMVYTDYPGFGLKNNLNLQLTAPDGTRRVGNASGNNLTFDTKNNVEVAEIANPAAGTWKLQVFAANVPQGPQPLAVTWLA